MYGKDNEYQAPDLILARKEEKDKISLRFDHVENRIYTFDVPEDALPFTAIDEEGPLQIKSYEINLPNELKLAFDREIKGHCQVNGAYEQNPKFIIPIDFASHLPILSFYAIDVLE